MEKRRWQWREHRFFRFIHLIEYGWDALSGWFRRHNTRPQAPHVRLAPDTLEERVLMNSAPVGVNDHYYISHGQTLQVNAAGVLSNDTDDDLDPLTAVQLTDINPTDGTLIFYNDGSFFLVPQNDVVQDLSFTYKALDQQDESDPTTVTVHFTNEAPVITDPLTQHSAEGDPVYLEIVATDFDDDPIALTVTDLPDGLFFDEQQRLIWGVIGPDAAVTSGGRYAVHVTASDGIAAPTLLSFTWDVQILLESAMPPVVTGSAPIRVSAPNGEQFVSTYFMYTDIDLNGDGAFTGSELGTVIGGNFDTLLTFSTVTAGPLQVGWEGLVRARVVYSSGVEWYTAAKPVAVVAPGTPPSIIAAAVTDIAPIPILTTDVAFMGWIVDPDQFVNGRVVTMTDGQYPFPATYATATADEEGKFAIIPGPLPDGLYSGQIYFTSTTPPNNSPGTRVFQFVYDTTAPTVTLAGPAAYINTGNPTVEVGMFDVCPISENMTVVLDVDADSNGFLDESELGYTSASIVLSGGFATVQLPIMPELPEGFHAVRARVFDQAGLEGTSFTAYFTVDLTPPVLDFIDPPAATNNRNPAIQVAMSDNYSLPETTSVVLSIYTDEENPTLVFTQSQQIGANTNPLTFNVTPALADGHYLVEATAQDQAGNPAMISAKLLVDGTAPTVTLVAPAATNSATPQVSVTASDNFPLPDGTLVYIDIDGQPGQTSAPLLGGQATFNLDPMSSPWSGWIKARVVDAAGNTGYSDESDLDLDTTWTQAISLSLSEDTSNGQKVTANPRLVGQISDLNRAIENVTVTLSGGWSATLLTAGDGSYVLDPVLPANGVYEDIIAEFTAGDSTIVRSQRLTFTWDDIAPIVTLTGPAYTTSTLPQLHIQATDNIGLPTGVMALLDVDWDRNGSFGGAGEDGCCQTQLDENGEATFTLNQTFGLGAYLVRAHVKDRANNQGDSADLTINVVENYLVGSPTVVPNATQYVPTDFMLATFTNVLDPFTTASDYRATIHYWSGPSSYGSEDGRVVNLGGTFGVLASHAFSTVETYNVGVYIEQRDGPLNRWIDNTITVVPAAPLSVDAGLQQNDVTLGTAAVVNPWFLGNSAPGSFNVTVDWHDGDPVSQQVAANVPQGWTLYPGGVAEMVSAAVDSVNGSPIEATGGGRLVHLNSAGTTNTASYVNQALDIGLQGTMVQSQAVFLGRGESITFDWYFDGNDAQQGDFAQGYMNGDLLFQVSTSSGLQHGWNTVTWTAEATGMHRLSFVLSQIGDPIEYAHLYLRNLGAFDQGPVPALTHTYADPGMHEVTVRVTDAAGRQVDTTASVFVHARTLTGTGLTPTVPQGAHFTDLDIATFQDLDGPLSPSDYTATITWDQPGDADFDTSAGTIRYESGAFIVSLAAPLVNRLHAAEIHEVEVLVTHAQAVPLPLTAYVDTIAPPLEARAATLTAQFVAADEGVAGNFVVAQFTENNLNLLADSYETTIDWGDGNQGNGVVQQIAPGQFEIVGNHTYATDGIFAVTVQLDAIHDPSGARLMLGSALATSSAVVANTETFAAADGAPLAVTLGNSLTDAVVAVLTVDNAGTLVDAVATIDWGDGVVSAGAIVLDALNVYHVLGSHTYDDVGNYRGRVDIAPARAEALVVSAMTDVGVVLPTPIATGTIVPAGVPLAADEDVLLDDVVIATFTHELALPENDYAVSVNWDDGSPDDTNVAIEAIGPGAYAIHGSHTYAEAGLKAVLITITTDDTTARVRTNVWVAPAAVTLTPVALRVPAGHALSNLVVAQLDAADLGRDASWFDTATVDWGDGFQSAAQVVGSHGVFFVVADRDNGYAIPAQADEQFHGGAHKMRIRVTDRFGTLHEAFNDVALTPLAEADAFAPAELGWIENPNPAAHHPGDYDAVIAWGDALGASGAATYLPSGVHRIAGPGHAYLDPGDYVISTTVADPGLPSPAGMASLDLTQIVAVADRPLVSFDTGNTLRGYAGGGLSDSLLLSFADNDPNAAHSQYSAAVYWGDGEVSTSVGVGVDVETGRFVVSGGHSYQQAGIYRIVVVLTAQDGTLYASRGTNAIIYTQRQEWQLDVVPQASDPARAATLSLGHNTVDLNTGSVQIEHALDFDLSPGRAVGLAPAVVYSSNTVDVRPVFRGALRLASQTPVPDMIRARLTIGTV